jgi:hypothetical protein
MQPRGAPTTPPAAEPPWHDGNRVVLALSDGASACTWDLQLGAGGDLRLVLDERTPHGDRSGEIVIVAGAALLCRGGIPEGEELDAVDGPGLMIKLVLELLGRAIPGGPAAVTGPVRVDHGDLREPLEVTTPSARASFAAPWRVQGEVRRADRAGIALELAFTYATDGGAASPRLSGTWDREVPAPALDDRMSLDGWRVCALGPRVGAAALDFRAEPARWQAATLGELRALAAPGASA